jgi:hypothetical protein
MTKYKSVLVQDIYGEEWEWVQVKEDDVFPETFIEEVNSPKHYTLGGIETIDYIEAKGLSTNYYLANVIKYVSRCGHKADVDPLKDLKKAQWYLNRYIKNLEDGK